MSDDARPGAARTGIARVGIRVALLTLVLSTAGCTTVGTPAPVPATRSATAGPSASSTPAAAPSAAPLTCGDLGIPSEIAAAFTPSGATASPASTSVLPLPRVPAVAGDLLATLAVPGAGGLSCAWSVGTAGTYSVQVLPDSAARWNALLYGDGPTPDRRSFAGIRAAATCGDPGCGASAVVGAAWVRVDMGIDGFSGSGSALGPETDSRILSGATPAIDRAFTAVRGAGEDRLAFPSHPGRPPRDGTCGSFLTTARLAAALGASAAAWQERHLDGAYGSIEGAAQQRIGSVQCRGTGRGDASGSVELQIAPGQAWAVAHLVADPPSGFDPTRLPGQTGGETALSSCSHAATACEVLFTVGDDAIQVSGSGRSVQVAEAVLAQAR